MRNHIEKAKDMAESVLPSTSRVLARKNRRALHKVARARARQSLSRYLADPDLGDDLADAHVANRRLKADMGELVRERRGADKVGPLCRWAERRVATAPDLAALDARQQLDYFRRLMPDNLIGRHAVSHIEWTLAWRRVTAGKSAAGYADARVAILGDQVRAIVETGGHAELNRRLKRLSAQLDATVRPFGGIHDIEDFARYAYGRRPVAQIVEGIGGQGAGVEVPSSR